MQKTENKGLNISVRSFIMAIIVIFELMVASYMLTFLVPGGSYTRVLDDSGNWIIDTGAPFSYVEGGIPFWKWLLSPVLILGASGGGTLIELAVSMFVINMRYALMSISLTQKFGPDVRFLDRFWIAFCNTDEIFAVASGEKGEVSRFFMLGLILTP